MKPLSPFYCFTVFVFAFGLFACSELRHEGQEKHLSDLDLIVLSNARELKEKADMLFVAKHDPQGALRVLETALPLALKYKENRDAHDIYLSLAKVHESLASYDKAESILREALKFDRDKFNPQSSKLSDTLAQLGAVLGETGKFEEGERLLLEALKIREESGSWSMSVEFARRLVSLYAKSKDFKKAEAMCKRMMDLELSAHGPDSPTIIDILASQAFVQYKLGNLSDSRALFKDALRIFKSANLDDLEKSRHLAKIAVAEAECNRAEAVELGEMARRLLKGQQSDPRFPEIQSDVAGAEKCLSESREK